ncbi:hypothetical protein [Methylobacterium radiodurans]|nr:hypothetical protein [Methylobacterium radiodurans]
MNAGEIFVTFVISAVVLAVAYAAVLANERAAHRRDSHPGE